jgi:hypothetical protein
VDETRIAHAPAPDYALRRVNPDGTEEPAGAYPSLGTGAPPSPFTGAGDA